MEESRVQWEKPVLRKPESGTSGYFCSAPCWRRPCAWRWPKAKPDPAPQTPLLQSLRVELNTADFETLCILPGVGEKRAQAILDYREAHGPFRRVEDAAAVPGLTEDIVASWAELAYVS